MTHANVLAVVSAVMTIVPGLGSKDVYMAYLPLAHILELAAEVMRICMDELSNYISYWWILSTILNYIRVIY